MSGTLDCRECGGRLMIHRRRGQAKRGPLGVVRTKRCASCGSEPSTVELFIEDIPRLLRSYMMIDRRN